MRRHVTKPRRCTGQGTSRPGTSWVRGRCANSRLTFAFVFCHFKSICFLAKIDFHNIVLLPISTLRRSRYNTTIRCTYTFVSLSSPYSIYTRAICAGTFWIGLRIREHSGNESIDCAPPEGAGVCGRRGGLRNTNCDSDRE